MDRAPRHTVKLKSTSYRKMHIGYLGFKKINWIFFSVSVYMYIRKCIAKGLEGQTQTPKEQRELLVFISCTFKLFKISATERDTYLCITCVNKLLA